MGLSILLTILLLLSVCSSSIQFQIDEDQITKNGFRIESIESPGLFLGFENEVERLFDNISYELRMVQGSFMPTNETLWTLEMDFICDNGGFTGNFLKLFFFPQFYLTGFESSLRITTAKNKAVCFVPVYQSQNESFHLRIDSDTDGKIFLRRMNDGENVGLDNSSSLSNPKFFWHLRYNAFKESIGSCAKENGIWEDWGEWSLCSASCGESGIKRRFKMCGDNVKKCFLEMDFEEEKCNRIRCPVLSDYLADLWECYYYPPTNGEWSQWENQVAVEGSTSQCPGKLTFLRRRCNSPAPRLCGHHCGEHNLLLYMKPVWEKLNTVPVSYGAKDNSYGTFTLKKTARIDQFKFEYVSGWLRCLTGGAVSYWGCSYYGSDNIFTSIVKDSKIIFPSGHNTYESFTIFTMSPYNGKSPSIVFPASGYAGTKGEQLEIWFAEDFFGRGEPNNSGQININVYVKYL